MTKRIWIGLALAAAAFAPLVAAGVLLASAAAIALAAAASPEGITGASEAIGTAADLAKSLSARNWSAALAPALLLVGFVLKHPATGALFSKVPPRFRALAMLVGGGLSVSGAMIAGGTPVVQALLSGFQAASGATGLYEVWQGASGATNSGDVRAAVREAMALPDAKARDEALAKIGTGT